MPEEKTLTEIAQLRGTSREAVVRMRDRRGIQPVGKKGRSDLYNPGDFDAKQPSSNDQQSADYRKLFEKERAVKLQIENQKKRGELIDRAMAAQVFSEIYGIHRSILLNIGPSLSDTISALAGVSEAEKTLEIQGLIDNETYAALSAIKAAIDKFLRRVEGGKIKDDLSEPKSPPRRKRKPTGQDGNNHD